MKTHIVKNSLLLFVAICSLFISACDKDNNDNVNVPLVFDSLTATNDTIFPGGTTEITAIASGDDITYTWTATAGDILGSGNRITYVSPPCTVGENDITCTVTDKGNNKLSKSITIYVF